MPNPSPLARLRVCAVAIWRGGWRKFDRLADLLLAPVDDAYSEALEAGDPAPIFCARTTPAPAQLPAADRSLRREIADLRRELETLRSQSNFRADSLAAGLSVVFGYSQDNRNAAAELRGQILRDINAIDEIRAELLRHRRELEQFSGETNRKLAADDLQRHAHGQRYTDLRDEVETLRQAISRNEAFRAEAIKTFRDSAQVFAVIGHDIQDLRDRIETLRAETKAAPSVLDAQSLEDLEEMRQRLGAMEDRFASRTDLLANPSQN